MFSMAMKSENTQGLKVQSQGSHSEAVYNGACTAYGIEIYGIYLPSQSLTVIYSQLNLIKI